MKTRSWVSLAIVAAVIAASAVAFVVLWQWYRTLPGLFTLFGLGVVFQLAGVGLVIWDLRERVALGRNVDTYDRVLGLIGPMAGDLAPDMPQPRFKAALASARARAVQDDLVTHARVEWVAWIGPIVLTLGILLTGAAAGFGFVPLRG